MRKKNKLLIFYILIITLTSFNINANIVKDGIADLSSIDFEDHASVSLNGKWQMLWNRFAQPTDFRSTNALYVKVPDDWNNYKKINANQTAYGYATFYIRVKLSDHRPTLGIYITNASTAYEVYINDTRIGGDGIIGKTKSEMIPSELPKLMLIPDNISEFDLTIKVSNFYHPTGGIWEEVRIGNYNKLNITQNINLFSEILVIGALLFIAIYHLMLFFRRRSELQYLFITFGAIMVALRIGISGQHSLLFLFSGLTGYYEVFKRIVVINFSLSMISLFLIFQGILNQLNNRVFKLFYMTAGVTAIIMAFVPYYYGYRLSTTLTYIVATMIVYTISLFIIKAKTIEYGISYLVASVVLIFTVFNDALSTILFLNSGIFLIPYGVLAFLIIHADNLSKRFIKAFIISENLKAKLEEKVVERTKDLKVANQSKDTIFSIVSHDLMGPIGAVSGLINKIYTNYDNFDDIRRKRFLDQLNTSARNTLKMLENILLWSKHQLNEINIHKEEAYLNVIIQNEIENLNSIASEKQIDFIAELESATAFIDITMISVAIRNIISNSIKYSPPQSSVIIKTTMHNGKSIVNILDNGKGMEASRLNKIFEPYKHKSIAGTNGEKGTGLGLVISKSFLDLNNADIVYKSQEGKGVEVVITFDSYKKEANNEKSFNH